MVLYIVTIIVLIVILLVFAASLYIKDKRYCNKSVVETMGESLWDEIADEREKAYSRRRRFRKILFEKMKKGGD